MPYTGGFPRASEVKAVRARYDFAVDGGAVGDIELASEAIPPNALVLGGVLEVDTALTSGGSATVGVTVESAGDIVTVGGIGSAPWSTTGRKDVVPDFSGSAVVKTTAARRVVATIGGAALTAGSFDVILFYTVMGD